jgi:cysteine synthase
VKEIFDACAELARDPQNVVFNQFSEFGNYLAHYSVTGPALADLFWSLTAEAPDAKLRAFVAASGSGGTLAAGDYLKQRFGSATVAAEALECPTLLCNGYGEHNIQGIGDKHVPLIHNVMGTDIVTAVSDLATDRLSVLFNTSVGREFLVGRCGVSDRWIDELSNLGLSSICNVLASIKVARYLGLGADDVVLTVATDGADMYGSEIQKSSARYFNNGFDAIDAAATYGEHLSGASIDHVLELTEHEKTRIFNLGYYTWVEQRGVTIERFDRRRDPRFWTDLQSLVPIWDSMISDFNTRTGINL